MSTETISNATFISSITNTTVPSSCTDLMAYVEMLLVQEYDAQMKDMAEDIKINNRLKQAYREHKINVNNFLTYEQNDDGEVKLTAEEYELLNSQPDYRWDSELNDGQGGVIDYESTSEDIAATSNASYVDVTYDGDEVVAANESAEVHGDPHFNDADSATVGMNHTDWDFQGEVGHTYNYLQDSNLLMTATHEAWGDSATVVGTMNITLNGPTEDSVIVFDASSVPTLDGETMAIGTTYETADGGTASYNGTDLTVTTEEGYTILLTDEGDYLNGQVKTGLGGVMKDGRLPTGIIGSQFDADTDASQVDGTQFDVTDQVTTTDTEQIYEVDVATIDSELERLQMKLDGLNSSTELAQTELSTLTSQRKLAFETLSTMISKVFEGASTVVRNIK